MLLVVVAIQRPGLQLAAGQFTFVHQQMKRMLMVIALFPDGVEAGDELGFGQGSFFRGLGHRQSVIAR